ncbi:MAG: hypothetical protein JJE30_09145 [Desulfuromonadales bacterium]|nr:hypothetical protein [Desulfuromonadales bacterium]
MRTLMTMFAITLMAASGTAQAAKDQDIFTIEYCPSTAMTSSQTPGSLTAKFGRPGSRDLKPYIGTGLAYSLPSPQDKTGDNPTGVKAGVAGQVGLSIKLSEQAELNLDYKLLSLTPDALHGSNSASPQLFGLRLGCTF